MPNKMDLRTQFSSNFLYLRKKKGSTQVDIANQLDLKRTTVGNYETGNSVPDLETLVSIANYFGVSIDSLLFKDLSKDPSKKEDVGNNDTDRLSQLEQQFSAYQSAQTEKMFELINKVYEAQQVKLEIMEIKKLLIQVLNEVPKRV
jgi:transcriptional regulator with XRE-family HTH domain